MVTGNVQLLLAWIMIEPKLEKLEWEMALETLEKSNFFRKVPNTAVFKLRVDKLRFLKFLKFAGFCMVDPWEEFLKSKWDRSDNCFATFSDNSMIVVKEKSLFCWAIVENEFWMFTGLFMQSCICTSWRGPKLTKKNNFRTRNWCRVCKR